MWAAAPPNLPHGQLPTYPLAAACPPFAGDLYALMQKRRGVPLSEDVLMDWFVQVRACVGRRACLPVFILTSARCCGT